MRMIMRNNCGQGSRQGTRVRVDAEGVRNGCRGCPSRTHALPVCQGETSGKANPSRARTVPFARAYRLHNRSGSLGERRNLAAAALFLCSRRTVWSEPASPGILVDRGARRLRFCFSLAPRAAVERAYSCGLAKPAPALVREHHVRGVGRFDPKWLPPLLFRERRLAICGVPAPLGRGSWMSGCVPFASLCPRSCPLARRSRICALAT